MVTCSIDIANLGHGMSQPYAPYAAWFGFTGQPERMGWDYWRVSDTKSIGQTGSAL